MKKKYYFPRNHIDEWQFDRALAFTRTHARTQEIARSYLVEHLSLDSITAKFNITRQNVYRAANKLREDACLALSMIVEIREHHGKLRLQNKTKRLTHFFIFTEETLNAASKRLKVDSKRIISAVKIVIKKHLWLMNKDQIKEREKHFNSVLPFSRAGEKSLKIIYDHVVLLESLVETAKKHGVTKQNAYNIIQRFKSAECRYRQSLIVNK